MAGVFVCECGGLRAVGLVWGGNLALGVNGWAFGHGSRRVSFC
jgi:hypothetical protein